MRGQAARQAATRWLGERLGEGAHQPGSSAPQAGLWGVDRDGSRKQGQGRLCWWSEGPAIAKGWGRSTSVVRAKLKKTATADGTPTARQAQGRNIANNSPIMAQRLPRPMTPPSAPPPSAARPESKLSFGVVCSSNINRSMEAHVVLGNAGK